MNDEQEMIQDPLKEIAYLRHEAIRRDAKIADLETRVASLNVAVVRIIGSLGLI